MFLGRSGIKILLGYQNGVEKIYGASNSSHDKEIK